MYSDTLRVYILGPYDDRYLGVFEGSMVRYVDGNFELRENVFGDLERLGENLIEDCDSDGPFPEDRRGGELEFFGEDSTCRQSPRPLFHPVSTTILNKIFFFNNFINHNCTIRTTSEINGK
jgi:hypothetical protein